MLNRIEKYAYTKEAYEVHIPPTVRPILAPILAIALPPTSALKEQPLALGFFLRRKTEKKE